MIGDRCSYNYGMNNDETYTPCTKCGRPMAYCKGQCCGKPKGCQCKEYGPAVCGAIRQCEPKCPYTAVIPSMVVEHADSLKDLCDTFVHVSDINTTFYIDDKHRTIITWAGPVEYDNYDLATNSLGLRSQFLIDFANNRGAYYDKTGNYKIFNFGQTNSEPLRFVVNIDENTEWEMSDSIGPLLDSSEPRGVTGYADYGVDTTFTNSETSETISAADLFAILESGQEVILDNVPLGAAQDISDPDNIDFSISVDGVKLDNKTTQRAGSSSATRYSGNAAVQRSFETFDLATSLGVFISKYDSNGTVTYSFGFQGFYYRGLN